LAIGVANVRPTPDIPHHASSFQVLVRFLLRFVIVYGFAGMSRQGFGQALASLLVLTSVFCAILGATRREPLFGPALTHWDEAAGFGVMAFMLPAPV
jgi:hypothetical protein